MADPSTQAARVDTAALHSSDLRRAASLGGVWAKMMMQAADEIDRMAAEIATLRAAARSAGLCMTCIIQAPDTFGCTDCLNTGWDGGDPRQRATAAEAALAEATETWMDEHGTTWHPPTAWAYAQSCRVRDEARRVRDAERARADRVQMQASMLRTVFNKKLNEKTLKRLREQDQDECAVSDDPAVALLLEWYDQVQIAMATAAPTHPAPASTSTATAMRREFINELGNRIRITIEGPTSISENTLTGMEAGHLSEMLTATTSTPAAAGEAVRVAMLLLADRWEKIAAEHGVRQFTGNDHMMFAKELRAALAAAQEAANG